MRCGRSQLLNFLGHKWKTLNTMSVPISIVSGLPELFRVDSQLIGANDLLFTVRRDYYSCLCVPNAPHDRRKFTSVLVNVGVLPQRSSCIEIARFIPSNSALETVPA